MLAAVAALAVCGGCSADASLCDRPKRLRVAVATLAAFRDPLLLPGVDERSPTFRAGCQMLNWAAQASHLAESIERYGGPDWRVVVRVLVNSGDERHMTPALRDVSNRAAAVPVPPELAAARVEATRNLTEHRQGGAGIDRWGMMSLDEFDVVIALDFDVDALPQCEGAADVYNATRAALRAASPSQQQPRGATPHCEVEAARAGQQWADVATCFAAAGNCADCECSRGGLRRGRSTPASCCSNRRGRSTRTASPFSANPATSHTASLWPAGQKTWYLPPTTSGGRVQEAGGWA
eukprot:TRINITY_DN14375_c0_g1_i1.p2 TRINITY_DN14375_c0_g1~~TRINITY_DN14375_c0_g1_i1.p2  ORF type:complete len:310 (+),score=79.62 TRINITY_DN14375_c0_g1_i1:51-932(+)